MKNIGLFLLLIVFFYKSANAEIVKDIKIENNTRVSKESIIAFGNIKLGSDYKESELNEILIELYKTNFFSNIKLKIENGILIVNVEEKKIVQSVILEGIKSKQTRIFRRRIPQLLVASTRIHMT